MKEKCDCCSKAFEILDIRVITPIILDDKIRELHLCRPCFLESDSMTFTEFSKFRAKGGQKEEERKE